jgi:hypothetical protein
LSRFEARHGLPIRTIEGERLVIAAGTCQIPKTFEEQ